MVTLTDAKINNNYDFFNSVAPTTSEKAPNYVNGNTWLNLTTGYSYILTNDTLGTWTRIEIPVDNKFNAIYQSVNNLALKYINNTFKVNRPVWYTDEKPSILCRDTMIDFLNYECVFSKFKFTSLDKSIESNSIETWGAFTNFSAGDTIYISNSIKNNKFYTIDSIVGEKVFIKETPVNEENYSFMFLTIIPDELYKLIGRMIHYDIYYRYAISSGLKSETIGTYSYTKEDLKVGNLSYPIEIVSDLDNYQLFSLGGQSTYVE